MLLRIKELGETPPPDRRTALPLTAAALARIPPTVRSDTAGSAKSRTHESSKESSIGKPNTGVNVVIGNMTMNIIGDDDNEDHDISISRKGGKTSITVSDSQRPNKQKEYLATNDSLSGDWGGSSVTQVSRDSKSSKETRQSSIDGTFDAKFNENSTEPRRGQDTVPPLDRRYSDRPRAVRAREESVSHLDRKYMDRSRSDRDGERSRDRDISRTRGYDDHQYRDHEDYFSQKRPQYIERQRNREHDETVRGISRSSSIARSSKGRPRYTDVEEDEFEQRQIGWGD